MDQEAKTRMALLGRLGLLETLRDLCREYHVRLDDVVGRTRTKAVVTARDACFVRMHRLGLSYNEIATAWGFCHTSVSDGIRRHMKRNSPQPQPANEERAKARVSKVKDGVKARAAKAKGQPPPNDVVDRVEGGEHEDIEPADHDDEEGGR